MTHDYWVPSLREWLNRKQRSTRKGQAELKLAERAANWTIKSERKQLPTLREWLSICWRTRTGDWKKTEAWMMKQATRHHFTRLAIGLTLSVAALSSTLLYWGYISGRELETRVAGLVASLFSAEPSQLPLVITKLDEHCDWALQELQLVLNTPASTPEQKRALLHSRIFAVGFEPWLVEPLVDEMLTNKISYLPIIRDRLEVQATPLLAKFRQLLSDSTADSEQRLRAAMVLLKHVPPDDASFWTDGDWRFISQQLVSANPELHPFIRQQIRLANNKLLSSLEELAVEPKATELELLGAANALIYFAEDDPKRLAGILANSNPSQFAVLFPTLAAADNQESHEHLQNLAKELPADDLGSVARINFGKRRAGAAIGLLKLGKLAETLSALECTDDPEAMTQFIFGSRARGVRVEEILKSFDLASEAPRRESTDKTKYALLLALGEFDWAAIPLARRGALLNQLSDLYASDPSSAVHGATGWLLRHWGHHEIAYKVDQTPVGCDCKGHVDSQSDNR